MCFFNLSVVFGKSRYFSAHDYNALTRLTRLHLFYYDDDGVCFKIRANIKIVYFMNKSYIIYYIIIYYVSIYIIH